MTKYPFFYQEKSYYTPFWRTTPASFSPGPDRSALQPLGKTHRKKGEEGGGVARDASNKANRRKEHTAACRLSRYKRTQESRSGGR